MSRKRKKKKELQRGAAWRRLSAGPVVWVGRSERKDSRKTRHGHHHHNLEGDTTNMWSSSFKLVCLIHFYCGYYRLYLSVYITHIYRRRTLYTYTGERERSWPCNIKTSFCPLFLLLLLLLAERRSRRLPQLF